MRKSIVSTLFKRKRKRRIDKRIKYKDALLALKAYQNDKLKLERVIDNVLNPSRSISDRCQVDGCNRRIRYEYVLRSLETGDILISGSECVKALLDLSESQVRDFDKIEKSIKDFHRMIAWKKENPDVYAKIKELEKRKIMTYEPFWIEIQYTDLVDEDTEFIRKLDVDEEERKYHERLERIAAYKRGISHNAAPVNVNNTVPAKNDPKVSGCDDASYQKVLDTLERLVKDYPNNNVLVSIRNHSFKKCLTDRQVYRVKVESNKEYFEKNVKDNPKLMKAYEICDEVIRSFFRDHIKSDDIKVAPRTRKIIFTDGNDYQLKFAVEDYKKELDMLFKRDGLKGYWNMYRLKNNIFLS